MQRLFLAASLGAYLSGCSCEPLVAPPDGGDTATGGGAATGGGSASGGGTATGGGSAGGGGTTTGGGSATGGGTGGTTQFTEYVRALIVTATDSTGATRSDAEFVDLPDDMRVNFSADFFDGGSN